MDERQHIFFQSYYCVKDPLQFDRILNAVSIFFSLMFALIYTISLVRFFILTSKLPLTSLLFHNFYYFAKPCQAIVNGHIAT